MDLRRSEDYAFTGQLVYTSTTTSYDPKRKAWIKRTVEYIDIGRSSPVAPANGDDELRREKLWHKPRQSAVELDAIAVLRQYGPLTYREMSKLCGRPIGSLQRELSKRTNVFVVLGKTKGIGSPDIIGLVGIHDKEAA